MLVAMILTGLTMRTAVTSVGAVLDDLEKGLHVGSGIAGLLTSLPVLVFAIVGTLAPRIARHTGEHRLLVTALGLMTAGLVTRAFADSIGVFLLLSVLALVGGAVSNVLMPSLVKRHFPDRIGTLTAVYTTALAVGVTAAAGLSVPIGSLAPGGDGWRLGLGSWALLSGLALLPWLPALRGDRPASGDLAQPVRPAALRRSPTAWAMALFFGGQSIQAYIAFGWFAKFLRDHGASAEHAGLLVAFYTTLSIPTSMVLPLLAGRGQHALVATLGGLYLCAYLGLILAPMRGAWLWMLLAGLGSGMFPLALTMVALRTRATEITAALSAFTQGVGYVIAGAGPLLVGLLLDVTGSWTWPFVVLFTALGVGVVAGLRASRPVFVDDELVGRPVAARSL